MKAASVIISYQSHKEKRASMKPVRTYAAIIFLSACMLLTTATAGCRASATPRGLQILRLTQDRGVEVSDDRGESWDDFNRGLPDSITPLHITADRNKTLYLATRHSGIYRRTQSDETWRPLNSPKFRLRTTVLKDGRFRKVTAFSVNGTNPSVMSLATKHNIYRSRDGGKKWTRVVTGRQLPSRHYITALAFSETGNDLVTGTSFGGVFVEHGRGFIGRSRGLPSEPYSKTLTFIEEIGTLHSGPGKALFAGINFTGDVFISRNQGRSWKNAGLPGTGNRFDFVYDITSSGNTVYASSSRGIYEMDFRTGQWKKSIYDSIAKKLAAGKHSGGFLFLDHNTGLPPVFYRSTMQPSTAHNNTPRAKAGNRRAIYASVHAVRRNLGGLISTCRATGLNAIVIDMKDDFGNLYFPTDNTVAKQIRALRRPLDVKKVLQKLKENNIYTIARIVVFKDRNLFRAYNSRYAIQNRRTGGPWTGNDREFWVDPHSDFVQRYTIDLAKDIAALGFDEIQFDYIRFPSDGPIHLCHYRYRTEKGMYKSEALADFLRKARREIAVPISVDLYGFTAWYRFGNLIGQDIEEFAEIVDVISPMVYPSHYGTRFYMNGERRLRPYKIVRDSGLRSLYITDGTALIRPYLQAFNLLSPTWGTEYIQLQIKGARESGGSGFIFWNAGGNYEMVRKSFSK